MTTAMLLRETLPSTNSVMQKSRLLTTLLAMLAMQMILALSAANDYVCGPQDWFHAFTNDIQFVKMDSSVSGNYIAVGAVPTTGSEFYRDTHVFA